MKTIAYYLRNSTDIQDYQYQLENLDKRFNQFKDVRKLVYAEKVSGFKSEKERPLMNQLLNDVDAGLIDEIYCNNVTRLSRDAINMQIIVKHCQEKGVNIYFDEQNLNTLDSSGKADFTTTLLINILGQFSEANARDFKSKGKQGKITKAKQGHYVGGLLSLGYNYKSDSKEKEIIINEDEKKVVEYIFDSYVNQNKSLLTIARDLNNLKETNSNFNNKFITHNLSTVATWRGSTIRHILKCKLYALGIGFFGGEEYNIKEELKFIDLDIYNKAQEKLTTNKANLKPTKHQYILNNLLYCNCGSRMYGKINNDRQISICGTIIKRESDKNFSCNIGKQIQIEQVENAVWLLIKNKLPDFKIEISEKSNKEDEINESIENNNQLMSSIKTNTIENLKRQRQRTIDTFNKFGGDENKLNVDVNSIDNQIKIELKSISNLKSDNKILEMSIKNLDIASEIDKNIQVIESDKNLLKFYCEKLIYKIIILGIKGTNTNVYKIIWNKNINNNNDTFLIHNSRIYQKPNFYYISSEQANIKISWNTENKTFEIYDSEINETIELTVNQMIANLEKIDYFFNDDSEYDSTMNFLIHFVNYDFYDKDNNLIPKKDLLMYDVDLLKRKFNFNNNAGIQKLQIVTPFV